MSNFGVVAAFVELLVCDEVLACDVLLLCDALLECVAGLVVALWALVSVFAGVPVAAGAGEAGVAGCANETVHEATANRAERANAAGTAMAARFMESPCREDVMLRGRVPRAPAGEFRAPRSRAWGTAPLGAGKSGPYMHGVHRSRGRRACVARLGRCQAGGNTRGAGARAGR